ncbi:hypothetical protein ACFX2I_023141 [Malus domestica]
MITSSTGTMLLSSCHESSPPIQEVLQGYCSTLGTLNSCKLERFESLTVCILIAMELSSDISRGSVLPFAMAIFSKSLLRSSLRQCKHVALCPFEAVKVVRSDLKVLREEDLFR